MTDLISFAEFIKVIGFPGLIFLIWYLFWRGEKQKWEMMLSQERELRLIQKEKEDADRAEHVEKWKSMIAQHRDQVSNLLTSHDAQLKRSYEIADRQAQAIELTAVTIERLIAKIDTNQYCPAFRKE